jgi:hypothetical protein
MHASFMCLRKLWLKLHLMVCVGDVLMSVFLFMCKISNDFNVCQNVSHNQLTQMSPIIMWQQKINTHMYMFDLIVLSSHMSHAHTHTEMHTLKCTHSMSQMHAHAHMYTHTIDYSTSELTFTVIYHYHCLSRANICPITDN